MSEYSIKDSHHGYQTLNASSQSAIVASDIAMQIRKEAELEIERIKKQQKKDLMVYLEKEIQKFE